MVQILDVQDLIISVILVEINLWCILP